MPTQVKRANKNKTIATLFLAGLCLAAPLGSVATPVLAQVSNGDVQGIEAIVNDQAISVYDVNQRLNLILSSVNVQISPEQMQVLRRQALQNLIDEKLQLQEAANFDLVISDEEADETLEAIAQQYQMTLLQFAKYLAERGASLDALRQQVKAELAWSQLVRGRYRQQIEVSEEEVQAVIKRMEETAGQNEYQVSEIFLQVDVPSQEPEARANAEAIIEQIKQGVPFNVMARQFSESPTAAVGGDLGWVTQGQLPPQVEQALQNMRTNDMSDPIRTENGFSIVLLRDRRKVLTPDVNDTELTIHQLLFDIEPGESEQAAQSRITQKLSGVKSCADIPAGDNALGAKQSNRVGNLRLGDLPASVQAVVQDLPVGKPSAPLASQEGVRIVFVCDRHMPESKMPSPEAVQAQLTQQKVALTARRYLRDLRRDGIIDFRR